MTSSGMQKSSRCNRFDIDSAKSLLEMKARSSLLPIEGTGTGIHGYVEAACEDGRVLVDPPPRMHVELPVESLRSGNPLEDREMHKLVGSRAFPTLIAELREARASDRPDRIAVKGAITVRGTTQVVDGELALRCDGDCLIVDGERTFDVRTFGIEPPRILMLKVYPEVSVRLHLVARKEG
ncbi:MAG: YceI family protein [Vulcanimicrobiaceae bacterium]